MLVCGYIREYCRLIKAALPSQDLIELFVKWAVTDLWDDINSHSNILMESPLKAISSTFSTATCIGKCIVKRGGKKSWTFKTNSKYTMVGIVSDEIVNKYDRITDFTDIEYGGYGISLSTWKRYHTDSQQKRRGGYYSTYWNNPSDGSISQYAQQFRFDDQYRTLTMELDMTHSRKGTLCFIIHHKIAGNIAKIKTLGDYTNIAFDTIDLNKNYHAAFALQGGGSFVEL